MCGICGFSGQNNSVVLKKMNACLLHRGPDDLGTFEDSGISLGHTRLKIIDLSKRAAQPMQNEDGTVSVVFNGEIYNFLQLRKELEKKHSFKSDSDTEVLLHLYEEKGTGMLSMLEGMFAFAIWDSKKKRLLLARDQLGIKPLYYAMHGGQIFFASEIKSILETGLFAREANLDAINELLCFRVVLGDKTLFRGIKKLLPGNCLVFDKGLKVSPYWTISAHQKKKTQKELEAEFKSLFDFSVKEKLVSDVPIGAFLSGGLDSSAVVATMSKFLDKPVQTFTVGFGMEGDEFKYAKGIAEKFGTDHHEVVVDLKEMTRALPKLIWNMDEPISDIAFLPIYFLTKKAREKITVALLGEGSDELFAGYKRYAQTIGPFKFLPPNFRAVSYLNQDIAFRENERKKVLAREFHEALPVEQAVSREFFSDKKSFLDQALFFDAKELLPNYQLARVDRVTMSCGLEARVPFLDRRIAEFAFSLPEKMKINGKTGKYIMKRAFEGILPKELLTEKKRIFFIPVKKWFDESFGEVAKQILDEKHIANRGIFECKEVKKKFAAQKNGVFKGRNSNQLLMLAMIEIWFQTFIDRPQIPAGGLKLNELE